MLWFLLCVDLLAAPSPAASVDEGPAAIGDPPVTSPQVLAIFADMQTATRRLFSIQYESRSLSSDYKEGQLVRDTESVMKVALENEMYYIDLKITDKKTNKMKVHDIVAYNSENYQMLVPHAGTLEWVAQQPKSPHLQPLPILAPYIFTLGEDDRLDYISVLNSQNWEELAPVTELGGRELIRDHDCQVLTIKRHMWGAEVVDRIYAAVDSDYLPIKVISETDGHRAILDVLTHREVETGQGSLFVPIEIDMKRYTETGELLEHTVTSIDPVTLEVNQDIPDELFTIPQENALILTNGNTGDVIDRRASTKAGPTLIDAGRNRLLGFLFLIGVILAASVILLRRRSRT